MKIYTKKGDRGTTSLFSGTKVSKDHRRVEAYGSVDELNALLGTIASHWQRESDPNIALEGPDYGEWLNNVQSELFILGSDLANPRQTPPEQDTFPRIGKEHARHLEETIDLLSEHLEPLKNFILPGGHILASLSHQARTVTRRAERCVVALKNEEAINEWNIIYLNRLSDALFQWARHMNRYFGYQEPIWQRLI